MKKFFLLSAALMAVATVSAQDSEVYSGDVYLCGSSVNGKYWSLAEADAQMTPLGNGVYEWDGEFLGTGFKLNDGTWSTEWAGGDLELSLGEPFIVYNGGANIGFDGFTGVKNPHMVFDVVNMTITLTGEQDGVYEWYLVGDFNSYHGPGEAGDDEVKFSEVGAKLYAYEGMEFTTGDTTIKLSDTGWHKQYGDNEGTILWGVTTETAAGVNGATLQECGSEGAMPCYLFGKYNISWNLNTLYLEFVEEGDNSVNAIEAVNGAAQYFNLQGVQVNEPANGLYIKVVNGKATKVVIR